MLPTDPPEPVAPTEPMMPEGSVDFIPLREPRRHGPIPRWGWVLTGAGILLLAWIFLQIAL